MALTASRRGSVFGRLGRQHRANKGVVCRYWLAGKCNRNPCKFLHEYEPNAQPRPLPYLKRSGPISSEGHNGKSGLKSLTRRNPNGKNNMKSNLTWRNPNYISSKPATVSANGRVGFGVEKVRDIQEDILITEGARSVDESSGKDSEVEKVGVIHEDISEGANIGKDSEVEKVGVIHEDILIIEGSGSVDETIKKGQRDVCQDWINGNCIHGDKCRDLHSWFYGSELSLLAMLEGHTKGITGITLPSGSDKLFSGSKDASVRMWDCHSGQCVRTVIPGSEIGCILGEGPWVFVGVQNAVKAWNFQTQAEFVLDGPNGLVNALDASDRNDGMLFAGVEDGSILAWKSSFDSNCPEFVATLKGHNLAVLSLVVGNHRLYSGSKDGWIRVWDVKTLQCLETLIGHTDYVTSLLCWGDYMISGSLDKTLKVWGMAESGKLEGVYEVVQASGVCALRGINEFTLLCSCKDNTVGLYHLPSFVETGRIFSKTEVQTIQIGCDGLFFTGDVTGQLSVWRLLGESTVAGASETLQGSG